MKKGQNFNHPKEGSRITTDPIREEKAIKRIKRMLRKNSPRDYLLFVMGINNGLRMSDLLRLKISDVQDLQPGETFMIREQKTKKDNILMINRPIDEALQDYFKTIDMNKTVYLFQSRKRDANGCPKPISIQMAAIMVKKWTKGLKGNYSTHSLRKTWGYHQRTRFGISFAIICKRFCHSCPSITMRYLGIEDREVNDILLHEI